MTAISSSVLDVHPRSTAISVAVGMGDVDRTIARAQDALLSRHDPKGYWCGELQGDSILESEYILLKFILKQEDDPKLVKIGNYLRGLQQPDGGWNMYPGGKSDLSGTVKAYFALKLLGDDAGSPHMLAAKKCVLKLGGAEGCNSFSNFYLAALGQISYDVCPAIPPEIVFLPRWFYFNLYSVSAWTRTMILPLAIVSVLRPVREVPVGKGIAELFAGKGAASARTIGPPKSWREFFLLIDGALKFYERFSFKPSRPVAMREAEKWLIDHLEGSEGLGAIFPPMVYILIVFRALGYAESHPLVVQAHKHLTDLSIEDGDKIRIQPCFSPVWDTGIALHALAEAEMSSEHETAKRTTKWLLAKECRKSADWQVNVAPTEPSGWFFEFENPHYPDVDDTAMVIMSLKRVGGRVAEPAVQRGLNWLLTMQNDDGGWAAFDKTEDRPVLEHVPFADHNAMQDPSCPDITGRVLESLGHNGLTMSHPAVRRAVEFVKSQQDADGPWWGRWGVNYVYGSWQVLTGLRAVGERMSSRYVKRAADWLRAVQKPDGSWGETCDSYEDPSLKGTGESTPSQTAWGVMGLLATSGPRDPAIQRGIDWLIAHQRPDGNWDENFYTGTGFPKVFYLNYHLYRLYFPLMALGRYRRRLRHAR